MTVKNLIDAVKYIDEVIVFDNDHNLLFKDTLSEAKEFYGKEEAEEFWVVDNQPHKDPRFTTLCIVIK